MLLLLTILLLVVQSNSICRRDSNAFINKSTSSALIIPHNVRIQHIDVDTHSDIVIDVQTPHFSWQLSHEYDNDGHLIRGIQQQAYHILVTNVGSGEVVWNSGYVLSSSSTHILYAGTSFTSDTRYSITIKYYTKQHQSQWYSAYFRTALFSLTDWTGQWIGSNDINMNQLRTVTNIKSTTVQSATVYISGIGYYQLYVEGELIDPSRRLDVGWTTYQQRTLYTSYDLTSVLNTTGPKGIGIMLGQGWYNRQQWVIGPGARLDLSEQYGSPRVLMQLNIQYTDGTNQSIVTDPSWLGREGEHRYDSVYMGTTMDLRTVRSCWSCANFTDRFSLWMNASILPSPIDFAAGGQLSLQSMDPIRIGPGALHIATSGRLGNVGRVKGGSLTDGGVLKPISQDSVNGQVFDLGQNFAGWCKLSSLNAAKSTIIQLRYAELRYSRGQNEINFAGLYYENLANIAVMDTVVLNGTGNETFEPLFTYHGFRYLLVNGYDNINKDNVECYNAHSETTFIGNFTSSSDILNQIQHNILWTQLSNSMSLPTDCPQRNERRGWMGDAGLSIDETLFNFDYVNFYVNFLTMISDNQSPDGGVSDTVPFTVGFSPADPNWGTAYVQISWYLYEHTGDVTIIAKYYKGLQAWVDCLTVQYQKTGLAKMYYYWGDWASVQGTSNTSLVSSYAYLRDVHTFINMSQILNHTDNVQKYAQLYQRLADEFHRVFYNAAIGAYVDGSQAMNILPLALPDVVPTSLHAAVLNSLVNTIMTTGHFTGGIVSVAPLYPLLSKEGYHDLALKLALATSYPSYGYMFHNDIQNATTTWELWNTLPQGATASLNHHMFNTIGAWFYRYLAGIELNGLRTITIYPRMSFDADLLTHVKAEVVTIKGSVRVEWTRVSAYAVTLSIAIPTNLDAIVSFDSLIEKGQCVKLMCDEEVIWMRGEMNNELKLLRDVRGVSDLTEDKLTGVMSIRLVSGVYRFVAYWQ
jgi:alpha-L-rhamnosidase